MKSTRDKAKTILIVEDDKLNQRLFSDVLTAAGHITITVDNGASAMKAARFNKPDLIIMDIRLGAESGLEITRQLKSDHRTGAAPIIAVTANSLAKDKAAAMSAGCTDYLTKPVSISHLLSAVNRPLPVSREIRQLCVAS